jgi:DNA polymerase III subunit beta
MEFFISRETILEGIQKTLGIVEKRTTLPILSNVLIRTGEGQIRIVATNREIGLIADYPADVIQQGEITLSARKLYEMIREVQGEVVHLKMNDVNWVSIKCGKVGYKIPGIGVDDFPNMTDDEDTNFYKIKASILEEVIEKTFFAMSLEEMRIYLNGALMETEKDGERSIIKMVTTDGHRLAIVTMETGSQDFLNLEKGIIIPRKGISEIRKLIEGCEGEIEIGVRKGMCIIRKDGVVLKVSLIDSEYPDYRKVLPKEKGSAIEFDREQMLRSLKRMNVIASEKYYGVRIKVAGDKMLLSSTNPDIGEAYDEVDISPVDKEIEIGYNVNYLIDAIEVIDEKKGLFEIRDGLKPASIRPFESKDYMCIIMPMKI